jgi:hypothetical protein
MSRHIPRAEGPRWLAAVVGAMALAVALAWFTTPRSASGYPSPALPPAAHATPTVPAHATSIAAKASAALNRPSYNMEAGQKIAIDPATGQARPIEHEEVSSASAARQAEVVAEPILHPSGAVGALVPETADVYLVATKSANGAISIGHAQGVASATTQMRAGTKGKQEVRHDR